MANQGAVNRKQFLEGAPPVVAQMRSLLEANRNFSGGPLTPEERESYTSDIKLADLSISGAAEAVTVSPTITLEERLTLYRGSRRIDIRHLGKGHTSGDIVVHLPKEGILITGDCGMARATRWEPAIARRRLGCDTRSSLAWRNIRLCPGTAGDVMALIQSLRPGCSIDKTPG
jgi:glyoxylase-like metal-dependent hydrolase (beta-lactamase superfamily II)